MKRLRDFCVVLCTALAAPLAFAAGPLDGKQFVGDIGPLGKPATEKGDVISFEDGRFHSAVCDQWGFNKAEYRAVQEGDAIRFEATTLSDSHGKMLWRGLIRGATLEGGFTHQRKPSWWRPEPGPLEHWVKATLRP